MALAAVLFFYAANSEVAWLFLLSYWVLALIAASFFYAAWNRGFSVAFDSYDAAPGPDSPALSLPDNVLSASPTSPVFEGDDLAIHLRLHTRPPRTRGPVRATGSIGDVEVSVAAGVVGGAGRVERVAIGPGRRGPLSATGWTVESGDPLGLFQVRRRPEPERRIAVVLPRFASLSARPYAREVEATMTARKSGSGSELFGVRAYRPGDSLRRIHWRSSARHGELIVREYEPPGVPTVGIICDPDPPTPEAADQIARIAASEAWDCLRLGGRVVLWAPGCEPTGPRDERNLWNLLEWLALYPAPGEDSGLPPPMNDAVAVTASAHPDLVEALETVRFRGGGVRAWVVGDADLGLDIQVDRAGLDWPPA